MSQAQRVSSPSTVKMPGAGLDVAVIGAGLAGSACSLQLARRGFNVTVMDMGKSHPGGRASTRRVRDTDLVFDHGCQFFRASTPQMSAVVSEWVKAGVAAEYNGNVGEFDCATGAFRPREVLTPELTQDSGHFNALQPGSLYCGVPTMDSIPQYMATAHGGSQSLHLNTRVYKARWHNGKWQLAGEKVVVSSAGGADTNLAASGWNLGSYDAVVFADAGISRPGSPGMVTFEGALPPVLQATLRQMSALQREPQFSLMFAWDSSPPLLPFDAACLKGSRHMAWIANNATKPGWGRNDNVQCYVALTRPEFAKQLLGDVTCNGVLPPQSSDYIAKKAQDMWTGLQRDLSTIMGIRPLARPLHISAHRWGASHYANPFGTPTVSDTEGQFAVCGDFCLGAGVENAVLSGIAAADAITQMVAAPRRSTTQQ